MDKSPDGTRVANTLPSTGKRRTEMRSLKYMVVALTPLLGAGGFAQGLNLGMNDALILQAQAPAQAGSPTNAEVKPDAGGPRADDFKSTRRAHAKTRARKGEK